jgi:uncharacterized protein YjbI with pentapeptide repeats
LEVAAFSADLHGADLAGSIVRDCRLNDCNLSKVNLSRSSWLSGRCLRKVSFVDVTLRDVDLSLSNFEVNSHYINTIGGIWCTAG